MNGSRTKPSEFPESQSDWMIDAVMKKIVGHANKLVIDGDTRLT